MGDGDGYEGHKTPCGNARLVKTAQSRHAAFHVMSTVPSLLKGIPSAIGSLSRRQLAPHWSTP